MDNQLTFHGESPALDRGAGMVTLVRGAAFALSGSNGDLGGQLTDGLFMLDRRVLSRFAIEIDGWPLDGLTVDHLHASHATFVLRELSGPGRPTPLVITRRRELGDGLSEEICITNHSLIERRLVMQLEAEVDFANLFSVKRGTPDPRLGHLEASEASLHFSEADGSIEVTITSDSRCGVGHGVLVWSQTLRPHETWRTTVRVGVTHRGESVRAPSSAGETAAAELLGPWPRLTCDDDRVEAVWERGVRDLASLVLTDVDHPTDAFVAAGAPWFMTLFGRDSLWASWMALPWTTELAHGVLVTLARHQGRRTVKRSEEEPGRILHEVRAIGGTDRIANSEIYYGTTDATPLFVVMVKEAAAWGLDLRHVGELMVAVDAALDWILLSTDQGTEWLAYHGAGQLENQGWKDSWDAIAHVDGRLATPPICLVEVQAYVFAAFRARADLARWLGDGSEDRWRELADSWQERFMSEFWLDDERGLAMAVTSSGPVESMGSNVGHVLWSAILAPEAAALVGRQLVDPRLFSGFGIRTLASDMARYDPLSYHNGSVWPHDSGIAAAGLLRYGLVDEATIVIDGLLDAAMAEGGRFPELFSGLDRSEVNCPVPYPTSCSPQAWSAATGLLIARLCCGLDPSVPDGFVRLDPVPFDRLDLSIDSVAIDGDRVLVQRRGTEVTVSPLTLELVRG